MKNKKGFTLIELVMIIVLIGILAVVAIPKYFDMQSDAKTASEQGVVGGVRAGIYTSFAKNKAFPTALDNSTTGDCSSKAPCFDGVLSQGGITSSDWKKTSSNTYTGATGTTYTYTTATGEFK